MESPLSLPPSMRIDPRTGQKGQRFVLVTCAHCGEEFRVPVWQLRWVAKYDKPAPKFCSRKCVQESGVLSQPRRRV